MESREVLIEIMNKVENAKKLKLQINRSDLIGQITLMAEAYSEIMDALEIAITHIAELQGVDPALLN